MSSVGIVDFPPSGEIPLEISSSASVKALQHVVFPFAEKEPVFSVRRLNV